MVDYIKSLEESNHDKITKRSLRAFDVPHTWRQSLSLYLSGREELEGRQYKLSVKVYKSDCVYDLYMNIIRRSIQIRGCVLQK